MILPCLLLFLFLIRSNNAVLTVTTDPSRVIAKWGSTALLRCHFSVSPETVDFNKLVVQWKFQEKLVAEFDDIEIYNRPGAKLSVEGLRKGDASLSLTDVTSKDEGEYTCIVIYTPQKEQGAITLKVEAPPVLVVQHRTPIKNKKNSFRADVSGFYPEDITILWLRDGKVINDSTINMFGRNENGTFSGNSTLSFMATDRDINVTISCQVNHSSLAQPLQEDFRLIFGASPKVNVHPSEFYKGIQQTVTCDVKGYYPEAIAVKWLRNGEVVDKPNRNADGTYNTERHYQFLPTDEDKGSEIACEVHHETLHKPIFERVVILLKSEESTSAVVIVLVVLAILMVIAPAVGVLTYMWRKRKQAKPTVTEITPVKGTNKYRCEAANFFPGRIHFEWRLKSSSQTVLGHEYTMHQNDDGTSTATSTCTLTEEQVKKIKEDSLYVKVYHDSLKIHEKKYWVADDDAKPNVKEITPVKGAKECQYSRVPDDDDDDINYYDNIPNSSQMDGEHPHCENGAQETMPLNEITTGDNPTRM